MCDKVRDAGWGTVTPGGASGEVGAGGPGRPQVGGVRLARKVRSPQGGAMGEEERVAGCVWGTVGVTQRAGPGWDWGCWMAGWPSAQSTRSLAFFNYHPRVTFSGRLFLPPDLKCPPCLATPFPCFILLASGLITLLTSYVFHAGQTSGTHPCRPPPVSQGQV